MALSPPAQSPGAGSPTILRRQLRLPTPSTDQVWALAGFVCLSLFFFREAAFGGRILFRRDIASVWLPQMEAVVRCLADGSLPVWDVYRGFGQPLLADPNAEVFYPPAWIHWVMAPERSYLLFVLGHLCFSSCGIYALARRWGASAPAGFVGGALWLASGPYLSLASTWHHLAGASWMPWVILAADAALETGGLPAVASWGAAFGLQALAGSLEMAALTVAAIAFDVVARRVDFRALWGPRNLRILSTATLAAVVGGGLAAAQWAPAIGLALGSAREAGLPEYVRATWSVPPLGLLEVALPFHWLDLPLRPEILGSVLDLGASWLHSLYFGIPALALGLGALVSSKDKRAAVLLGPLALLSALVALGPRGGIYSLLVALAPPLRTFRYPMKVMVLAALALALLAALGFDSWRQAGTLDRRRWNIVVVGGSTFLALTALGVWSLVGLRNGLLLQPTADDAGLGPIVARLGAAAACAVAVACLAVLAPRHGPQAGRWLAGAVACLALGELVIVHRDLHPTARPGLFREVPAVLSALDTRPYARLYVVDYANLTRGQRATTPWLAGALAVASVPDGWNSFEALSTGGLQYLYPPGAGRWGRAGSYDQDLLGFASHSLSEMNRFIREAEPVWVRTRMLQMGSVSDVLALEPEPWWADLKLIARVPSVFREPISVLRVPHPLPRTYVVGRSRVADGAALLSAIADPAFDPTREVLLPSPPAAGDEAAGEDVASPGESRIVDYRPDRVSLEARLEAPGYVVLVDGYDAGWRATIDGRPAPVLRANGIFRAVHAGPGAHRIAFAYRPPSVTIGLWVSTLAILGLAVAFFSHALRKVDARS